MKLILWRSYTKARNRGILSGSNKNSLCSLCSLFIRGFSEDKSSTEFSDSTILIENGCHVQELPVVVRKMKDLADLENPQAESPQTNTDSLNYHLIQEEFKQCNNLREVFSLITKCIKITPNIALGAIERINDIENDISHNIFNSQGSHLNFAKGAILEKLLKVVMKTEDTQTILNILKTSSTLMEPYKPRFCDELLLRVIDNKLTIDQICEFYNFLISNNCEQKYSETIDKLWVGLIENEKDINEQNIVQIFSILYGLKVSKKTIVNLLEQKLSELWSKIKIPAMLEVLDIFIVEKYFSMQSYHVLGYWLYANIHALDDDALLDIITKFTRLKYNDNQIEAAVEKFLKLKSSKIKSEVLIIGILNYCMQFKLRNNLILEISSRYFLDNLEAIPSSFLKSFIYTYGYLSYQPKNSDFWPAAEKVLLEKYNKMKIEDLTDIILSFMYCGQYPLKLVQNVFKIENTSKINSTDVLKRLHLIDTSLTLACHEYSGPLLPKDQCFKPVLQDGRIKNIIEKILHHIEILYGDTMTITTSYLLPNFCSDITYLIDILLQPKNDSGNTFNWKSNMDRSDNIGILIHLPDHYCSDDELIGPQVMKIHQLNIIGIKVIGLKYSMLSKFYTSHNITGLKDYIIANMK
ncbi:uncharacterized protein LOC116779096 [Danaus plexippus]|uniref:uncharacterized protein LOC116779096 n=1 Tax=Danaus plexippus TaxID=13037 RepID=UPI002AB2050F|nr:uncharacterized protein LOC116779096 [Danaus plexippus]